MERTPSESEIEQLVAALDHGRDAWIHGRLEFTAGRAVAQADDMTIFGPFGGEAARNGPGFAARQAAIAAQFAGGHGTCELVSAYASGDLVVLVLLERSEVTFAGRATPEPWVLRTTQVFRRDGERWIRLHRHADPLIDRRALDQTSRLAAGAAVPPTADAATTAGAAAAERATGAIHHVDLTVADLARSTAFYDDVLPLAGFRRSLDVPEGPIWAGAEIEIGLVAARPASRREHDRYAPGLHHLALRAPDRAAVDRLHADLVARAVTILDAPAEYPQYAPGYYAVFFADPDGIKLEYAFTPHWPGAAREEGAVR